MVTNAVTKLRSGIGGAGLPAMLLALPLAVKGFVSIAKRCKLLQRTNALHKAFGILSLGSGVQFMRLSLKSCLRHVACLIVIILQPREASMAIGKASRKPRSPPAKTPGNRIGPSATIPAEYPSGSSADIFVWSDGFETGLGKVDFQHRRLVELLNELARYHVAGHDAHEDLLRVFDELIAYTTYHFATEEALMDEATVSEGHSVAHHRAHADFVNMVLAARKDADQAPREANEQILAYLTKWLILHILGMDRRMGEEVRKAQQASALSVTVAPLPTEGRTTEVLLEAIDRLYERLGSNTEALLEANRTLTREVDERRASNRQLRESENFAVGIMDSMNDHIAVIDTKGNITAINAAWHRFAEENGADKPLQVGVGASYFDVCLHAGNAMAGTDAASTLDGIRSVLAGSAPRFATVYPCHSDSELRWYELTVVPLAGSKKGAVLIHRNITEHRLADKALRESETLFHNLVQAAPFGIIVTGSGGIFEYINTAVTEILGYTIDDVPDLATWWAKAFPDIGYRQRAMNEWQRAVVEQAAPGRVTRSLLVRHLDGRSREIKFIVVPLAENRLLVTLQDVTDQKLTELNLRIAATAFESQEGMTITNAEGTILRVNKAFTEITGYTADEVVGWNPRVLNSGRHDAAFYANMWEHIARTGSWQGEIWNRRKNGEAYPEWLSVTAVKGDDGNVSHYVGTFTDITQRKTAEDKIAHLAFYDHLTELPNRRLMLDRLGQATANSARRGRHGALLLLDLDNFKTLNDTLGHAVGDQLLVEAADRLRSGIREGDTVARLGGDEFVVILQDLDEGASAATQAEGIAKKIQFVLGQVYSLAVALDGDEAGSRRHQCTASIGITLFRDQSISCDELLKRADTAMYQAKAAGRNGLRFFDPEMQVAVKIRADLEVDLRKAIIEGQFVLYYQAQVDSLGRVIGAEALVRWLHPVRGMVSPAEFIPLAEETGLILPLGHWVLETACRQLALWAKRPDTAHLDLAVNVSSRQFSLPNLVEQVCATKDYYGVPRERLKLELTESLLLENAEDTIEKMLALKAAGVRFSLDDFGTGYSSLSYLKRLPLDQLKIDQSFVRDILIDSNDAAIARTVIALAESLGLGVIAEGVELEGQRDLLANSGCQCYQGYFFSRPLPIEGFEEYIARCC